MQGEADGTPSEDVRHKRVRRTTPILMRAERVGVADQLRPLPDSPSGSVDSAEMQAYKRSKQAVQTANQQIVARREQKLLRAMR